MRDMGMAKETARKVVRYIKTQAALPVEYVKVDIDTVPITITRSPSTTWPSRPANGNGTSGISSGP